MLTEDLPLDDDLLSGSFIEEAETLEESFLNDLSDSLRRISPDGVTSEWDWISPTQTKSGKALPYSDQPTLDRMHEVGFRIYRNPNIQAAIETMVSFVVNRGWSYAVSKRRGATANASLVKSISRSLDFLTEEVSLGLRSGWYYVLGESYRRFLRDGEFFRRWFVRGELLSVRFIEPFDIRQPNSWLEVPITESVPDFVDAARRTNAEIPGELGVISQPTDAASPLGYWHRLPIDDDDPMGGSATYEYLPATRVQHCKANVDENDPRGVPAFYDTLCTLAGIDEVALAMNELAVKQSKYAVVVKHKATNRREAIQSLRTARVNELNDQLSNYNREPYETHTKNVDVEFGGMKTNARNYIEVIQQGQRLLGNVRQIPEFMITGDANTGNRSSLQSAESPFGRRVSRDQKEMWYFDRELMWLAMSRIFGWSSDDSLLMQRKIQITPAFPLADTRDRLKDSQMVETLLKNKVISRQQAARLIDVDFQQMEEEIAAAPIQEATPNGALATRRVALSPPDPAPGAPDGTQTPDQEDQEGES